MSKKLQGRVAAFRRSGSTFMFLGMFDPSNAPKGTVVTTLVAASSAIDRAHRATNDGARSPELRIGTAIPVSALPVAKRHTSAARVVRHRDAINARSRFEREFTSQATANRKVARLMGL